MLVETVTKRGGKRGEGKGRGEKKKKKPVMLVQWILDESLNLEKGFHIYEQLNVLVF